jgi:hypothetical protein
MEMQRNLKYEAELRDFKILHLTDVAVKTNSSLKSAMNAISYAIRSRLYTWFGIIRDLHESALDLERVKNSMSDTPIGVHVINIAMEVTGMARLELVEYRDTVGYNEWLGWVDTNKYEVDDSKAFECHFEGMLPDEFRSKHAVIRGLHKRFTTWPYRF